MNATVTKSVQEIPADARQILEKLLGRPLESDQEVFVMAYSPGTIKKNAIRHKAAESIRKTWKKIDSHVAAAGIPDDEIEAAIDEAINQVRVRSSR